MKTNFLVILILLLSSSWARAQYDDTYNPTATPVTQNVTVVGCLAGDQGSYTLTDQAGAIYRLTGDTGKLSAHVGHTIRVTGVSTSVMHQPGSMSEGENTHPTLSVVSFKHVKADCVQTPEGGGY